MIEGAEGSHEKHIIKTATSVSGVLPSLTEGNEAVAFTQQVLRSMG